MKYLPQNGFTKQKMLEVVNREFKGISAGADQCHYRNPAGLKCSVGCFIPDEVYLPEMERRDVSELMSQSKTFSSLMPLSVEGMLGLQEVHDYTAFGLGAEQAKATILNWINNYVQEDV